MERTAYVSISGYESAVDGLSKINSILEIVLDSVFSYDTIDLNGSEREAVKAIEFCNNYPTWREALEAVRERLVELKNGMAEYAEKESWGRAV